MMMASFKQSSIDRFLSEYESHFGQEYGYLRPIVKEYAC